MRLRHKLYGVSVLRGLLVFLCLLLPLPASALTLDGDWNGTLTTPNSQLRIMLRFKTVDGALHADLTSVDQNNIPVTASKVVLDGDKLTVEIAFLSSAYHGTVAADGASITGTWSQNGNNLPLDLKPGTIAPRKLVREPQPGDLTITTPTGTLAGTIWKAGDGKLAAVIITGSGPANRNGDSSVNGGRGTYRLIAEGLQAQGITALSFDKRGIGESMGALTSESALRVQTLADDVRAWAHELRTRTGARCVWLLGHSEGGLIAILAAKDNREICGIVSVAGMGRRLAVELREQLERTLPDRLKPDAFTTIDTLAKGQPVPNPPAPLMSLFRPSIQPYMMSELTLDPAALAHELKIPLLILQGDADRNVTLADANALAAARPDALLKILPGVNHAQRVADNEKATGPTPLAPGLTDTIADFLKAHR